MSSSAFAESVSSRSIHDDFTSFKSQHPLLKAHLPRSDLAWCYYQAGPITDADPIIFLHGTSGTAAAFFYQVQALAEKGYRAISAQYPAFYTTDEWCKGFDLFLDIIKCRGGVHLFGAGLGGFLAQHYASLYRHRVRSLVLCNAFASTSTFADQASTFASMVHVMPTAVLRKIMLDSFPQDGPMTLTAKQAIDWVALQLHEINGHDLAGRLLLNCTKSTVAHVNVQDSCITLIESSGETMVPEELRRGLAQRHPDAKMAQLKARGDFPFLSEPEEVTIFIEVHMLGVGVVRGIQRQIPSSQLEEERRKQPTEVVPKNGEKHASESDVRSDPPLQAPRPKWKNPFVEEDDL